MAEYTLTDHDVAEFRRIRDKVDRLRFSGIGGHNGHRDIVVGPPQFPQQLLQGGGPQRGYFPCQVKVDGGVAGSMSGGTSCTFTYSLFDLSGNAMKDSSGTAITGKTPDVPRVSNCQYDRPADNSIGVAYRDSSGTINLLWAVKEKPTGTTMTEVTGLQISGTAIQYKTNTALVLDKGTESGWTTLDAGTTCP